MNGETRPSLVETGKGLTVRYRDRFLYSERDPARVPSLTARQTAYLAETLVICPSPLLGYGLRELLSRLPERSFVLCADFDPALHALSESAIPDDIHDDSRIRFVRPDTVADLCGAVERLPGFPFRRCARIDLSAGSSLDPELWESSIRAIDSIIGTYWKNRVILMRLGRGFARNLLVNAGFLPKAKRVVPGSVGKAVFVACAGPSLDATLPFARANRASFFILAVDTALPALRASGLVPDAVVVLESQYWIERAFVGFRDSRIPVFADMTARPQAIRCAGGDVSFFHTRYAPSRFLDRFASFSLAPVEAPRLGSVGLSAIWLASVLARAGTPILFAGLDFSWGRGFTHARDAVASLADRAASTRLAPAGMAANAFASGVFAAAGKKNGFARTDPVLSGYAALCRDAFSGRRGIYDLGEAGLENGFPYLSLEEASGLVSGRDVRSENACMEGGGDAGIGERAARFLSGERERLRDLRAMLTGAAAGGNPLEAIAELDYLYLHFPDGHAGPSASQGFLNRVRVETEYFLKMLEIRASEFLPPVSSLSS